MLTLNLSLLYIKTSSSNNVGTTFFAFGFELRPRINVLIRLIIAWRRFLRSILWAMLNGPFLIVVVSLLPGFFSSIVIVRVGVVMLGLSLA